MEIQLNKILKQGNTVKYIWAVKDASGREKDNAINVFRRCDP